MKDFAEILVLVIYLAMLFTLVRPNSQGPKLVTSAGTAVTGLISAATGGGTW